MTTQKLNTRLTPLFEAHKQTVHLIHRLFKLPAKAGLSPQNPEAGDVRVELSAEILQNLKKQEEEFELLRQEVEDQTDRGSWISAAKRRDSGTVNERTALAARITRLGEDLRSSRIQFRKAQLQAKRNAEAAKRDLLFEDIQEATNHLGTGRRRGQEKLSQDELLLNASNDVTAALRETHALMQSEVSRSRFAHATLQQSTAALSSLSESYSNLDTLISSSRSLISSLVHSQKSDTWYLESAFWILVSTILWLVFRRLLYGPGWWFLYLPTRLIWSLMISLTRVTFGAVAAVVGASGRASESSVSPPVVESFYTSLVVQPSATGGIPKFHPEMSAPTIAVGGGGAGAKDQAYIPRKSADKLTEQMRNMAKESTESENPGEEALTNEAKQEQGTVLRERNSDEPPNSKKRMWEEHSDLPVQGDRARDEL
ncbi:hypothetical protein MMC07_009601 [Pseudocyphellaria aurata]|nr:hypothetical protein [Pseudocyphellaria aurata]